MAYAGKCLHSIRKSLPLITYFPPPISRSRQLLYARFEPLRRWMKEFEPILRKGGAGFRFKLNIQRGFAHNACSSGRKLTIGQIFGLSFLCGSTSICACVSYAMHGDYVFVGAYPEELHDGPDMEDDPHVLLRNAKKFYMPVFFILTVLLNWENPVALTIKLVIFLLGTIPSPSSVYLLAEKLCYQCMRAEPHLYWKQSLYAKKIEIQDYKLFCLAEVEVLDKKLKLLGILGGWWILPPLTSDEAMSVFRHCAASKPHIDRTRW